MKRVAAFTLYPWSDAGPVTRLVSPWKQAGASLFYGTHWDQVFIEPIAGSDLVHIHRDFPRMAKSYRQVIQEAHSHHKPVILDLDEWLFELPEDHPDRQFHYRSDALFPVLQAIVEADAVTVSTAAIQEALLPLNPNTWVLPTCLDDQLWSLKNPEAEDKPPPLIIGWVHDRPQIDGTDGFTAGLERFLRQQGERVLLRVWGRRPPETLLNLTNLDWLPELPLDYNRYAAYLSEQACDLFVSPSRDNPFDRSYAPLRFLEQSACGAPGVYSDVPPFKDVIVHRHNGWLASSFEEWYEALSELAGSADLRSSTAVNARQALQEGWLLSQNAHRWSEALADSQSAVDARLQNQSKIEQITSVSDQVRSWQRDLERQVRERDWEVRALNVMLKRKEREASEYINQLGRQLEEIWNDPAWRLLHKAERLVGKIKSPGSRSNPTSETTFAGVPGIDSLPASQTPSSLAAEFERLRDSLAPTRTFDIFYFASQPWEGMNESQQILISSLTRDGSRLFLVSPTDPTSTSPALHAVRDSIIALKLPYPRQTGAASDEVSPLQIETVQGWIRDLSQVAGIHQAISWVEDTAWGELAFILRNAYGWKVISTLPELPASESKVANLHLRSDLLVRSSEDLQQALIQLYPKASIIILTYNNLDYTRQCLESIYSKTIYPNFEVVIVDNASTDGTKGYLEGFSAAHSNLQLLLNKENIGFSAGNNRGVSASDGTYVVFLNNDTVLTPGWLSRLIAHLRDPAIGAVGPVTNYAGNESRIAVDYSDISGLDDFAHRYTDAHAGQTFEIRMLALFCMLTRRSVIDKVGPLDERFGVGMYEDDDFSLRMRQKGYRILCAEDVYVHHWGSASFSQIEAERFERLHQENRQKFEEKWGTIWQPHRWRMLEE